MISDGVFLLGNEAIVLLVVKIIDTYVHICICKERFTYICYKDTKEYTVKT